MEESERCEVKIAEVSPEEEVYREYRKDMDKLKAALAEYLANLRCRRYHEYMTPREVCELLNICNRTLCRYRQKGLLKGIKVNNGYRYEFKQVYALLQKNEIKELDER